MKLRPLLLLSLLTVACQSQPDRSTEPATTRANTKPATTPTNTLPTAPGPTTTAPPRSAVGPAKLALTANALQVVNTKTGSTSDIPLGRPFEQLVRTVTGVLGQAPARVSVNGECGAGPLKMATWANGLTLAFQEKNSPAGAAGQPWEFVGWSLNPGRGAGPALTTMAGVGLGSTRAEMESAYVIKVVESTLGQEFSTTSGLYGLFDGTGPQARVAAMWSGTSCVFR